MSKTLITNYSLKSFENQQQMPYQKDKNLQKQFYTMKNNPKYQYLEKTFQSNHKVYENKLNGRDSYQKRLKTFNQVEMNKSQVRNPLNQILKSNSRQNSFYGRTLTSKDKKLCRTLFTESNDTEFNKIEGNSNKKQNSKNKERQQLYNSFKQVANKSHSLIRLRQSIKHVKNLQQQMKKSKQRSCSSKKKGLECTLYQKSLQKKINDSDIKSGKKLITLKKKFQKTEEQWGKDQNTCQQELRKILIKNKNQQFSNINNSNCFNSVLLNKSKGKVSDKKQREKSHSKWNSTSGRKVIQDIISVSKNKKETLKDLNKSMNMIKKQRSNETKIRRVESKQKSKQNLRLTSLKKQQIQKASEKSRLKQIVQQNSKVKQKSNKIILNERIESNLKKIHEKYKFITSYLSDFDIIGRMNGYQVGGVQQCKWILLIIDDVYQMIKHSQQTKLKGIQHSRQYQFKNDNKNKQENAKAQQIKINYQIYQKQIEYINR